MGCGRKFSLAAMIGLAVSLAAPALAHAAWADDFIAICGGNLADFDKAIAMTSKRGYVEEEQEADAPLRVFRSDNSPAAILITPQYTDKFSNENGMSNALSRTCGATGTTLDAGGVKTVEAWLGFAPMQRDGDLNSYLFKIEGGRKLSLAGATDEEVNQLMANGGFWYAGVSRSEQVTTVTLTHIKATK